MSNTKLNFSVAYFRDQFVDFNDANLSIGSSPVLYGLSVYSVFNYKYDKEKDTGYVFRLREHFKRLNESCQIMGFSEFAKKYDYDQFESLIHELFRKNQCREDALVRTTVYVDELLTGQRIFGAKNSFSMYMTPAHPVMNKSGVHTCISSWVRTRDSSIPPRAKVNGNYVNGALMKNEATLNGYDEAIALTSKGFISEGSLANVFMVKNGKLVTPSASDDILIGITRNSIIRIADALGIECFERPINRTEIYSSDELFFSGSSAHITPILSVDRRDISEKAGPVTSKISEFYENVRLGKEAKFKDWVTEVKV